MARLAGMGWHAGAGFTKAAPSDHERLDERFDASWHTIPEMTANDQRLKVIASIEDNTILAPFPPDFNLVASDRLAVSSALEILGSLECPGETRARQLREAVDCCLSICCC